ncbi:MAG: biotin/lipoyl-containing protein [Verrucomicrobiota bacterium]|jgi:biotin carboxyl carrier protein
MIRKIRVTVDGKPFDVTVEIPDDVQPAAPPPPAPPSTASAPAIPAEAPPAPSAPQGAGDVSSPLAGHIIAVAVAVGQSVKKSDPLLTIEAMKMNTFVLAPIDGKVAAIDVKVGDVVSEGQLLIRIE